MARRKTKPKGRPKLPRASRRPARVPAYVYETFQKTPEFEDKLVGSVIVYIVSLYGIWTKKTLKDPDLPQRLNPGALAEMFHCSLHEANQALAELENEWKVIWQWNAGRAVMIWVDWNRFCKLIEEGGNRL